MAVADKKLNAGVFRGLNHFPAILDRQRHRLFDKHVLSLRGGELDVIDMILVRRGDIDGLDLRVGAKRVCPFVNPGAKFFSETLACIRARIAGCDHRDTGM